MRLSPDLSVVQEAVKPKGHNGGERWGGRSSRNDLAVFCSDKFKIEPADIDLNAPLSILPFRIKGVIEYNLLAVWTQKEDKYINGLNIALDVYSHFLKEKLSFVVGDFNGSAIWDKPKAKFDFSRLASRLENEFGYKSAYHDYYVEEYGKESIPTHYFRWNQDRKYHIDYIYVPKDITVESVTVGEYTEWAKLSDHRPLIVDLKY